MSLRRRPTPMTPQRGIGVIAAIAILVVLAGLAAFIVSVVGLRSQSTALDILGSRAYQAARTGIEWGMYQIQSPEDAGPPPGAAFACPVGALGAIGTLNSGNGLGGTLADFTVTVQCAMTNTYSEAGNSVRIYKIVAVACNIPNGGACPNNATTSVSYVERQVTVLTETCRTPGNVRCS